MKCVICRWLMVMQTQPVLTKQTLTGSGCNGLDIVTNRHCVVKNAAIFNNYCNVLAIFCMNYKRAEQINITYWLK